MTKLEAMLRDFEAAEASVAGLNNEISRLEMDVVRLDMEADTAAKEGNLSLYQEKRDAAKLAADKLFVCRKQLEGVSCIRTEQEARDAFREYAETYDRTFEKAWAAYVKKRENLYADFVALVHSQNAALKIREKCAALAGIDLGNAPALTLDQLFPMRMLPDMPEGPWARPVLNTPDTNYFLQLLDNRDLELFNAVVRNHLSV